MRYAYTFSALFAAVAVATPVINTHSESGAIGDIGVGAVAASDGNAIGDQNAKRDTDSLIGNDNGYNDYNDDHLLDIGSIGALKRSEDSLIGNDNGYNDGDLLDVGPLVDLKRSEEGIIEDAGIAAVAAGNGDVTGVKKAKREEDLLNPDLVGFANILKREQDDIIGEVGTAAVAAGNGDATGVENAKRDDIPDDAQDAESDAESAAAAQVSDAGQNVLSSTADATETAQPQGEKTEGTQKAADTDKKQKNLIRDVGLGLEALSNGKLASTSQKRSEGLSIDQNNVVTGAGVADDVDLSTPIIGLANP
ncbi:uncharacterized protein N7469_009652 [Penicillium citrinum]|uniref:Uncharacterized protein n=1 Tax=Penicillium citrinum TaxID=5077 RepID=A0A9W9NIU2_PENCI|nr:uncharacterized protein N7469_009652 [Penicillium citrinum]KAJ5220765.1 hypothetical protein N7469_009652 [Penicillium citrinum]